MSTAMLDDLVKTKYGIEPITHDVYAQISANCVDANGTAIRLLSSTQMITVIPDMHLISDAYDLVLVDKDTISLNHSGKSVYEDPIFSVVVTTTEANSKVQFLSAEKSTFGVATDTDAAEGVIEQGATGTILLPTASTYRITINMETYTYEIVKFDAPPVIYIPGNHQGWNPASAPQMLSPDMDMIYTNNIVMLNGGFKFTGQPDWSPTEYNYETFTSITGPLTKDSGSTNLVADPGTYQLVINLTDNTLTATSLSWSAIGSATPGGWDTDTPLVMSDAGVYTATMTLTGGNEIKFRANNDWPVNLGGDIDNLTEGGANIVVPEDGTYLITLDLSTTPFTVTMENQND
ncbi:MAG: SusF/SusE family outer membrane protein [Bacteroidaceae bacterium]